MNIFKNPATLPLKRHASTRARRRSGFTLIEIMVVLVIAAIISSIIVAGFSSLTSGNRRTQCQTNMSQIYAALRLYAADEGAFPPYGGDTAVMQNDDTDGASDGRGIGLWALYTFPRKDYDTPANSDPDKISYAKDENNPRNVMPIETYLRKVNALHCPSDKDGDRKSPFLAESGGITEFNPGFLSYQLKDPDSGQQTYKTVRVVSPSSDPDKLRQLQSFDDAPRTPPTDTVVFWCPWHRDEGRDRDIVLFYDGSIQSIDRKQDNPKSGGPSPLEDWHRVPTAE
jgi:prepilin-type N-terminal cleavage/methylation domain-containing protein